MAIDNMAGIRAMVQLPGLLSTESAIGRAWIEKHSAEFNRVEFNVRLGTPAILPQGSPEYMAQFARLATVKRADIVAHLDRDVTIVEIKVRIGGSAFGQLTLYKRLYITDHPEVLQVHLIAIGQTIEPDVAALFTENGIAIELFPSAGAPS